ncbi:MAG: aminomethyl-transferring glycine dehydrogenase subunit GcvPB [Candidatus Kryptoniota bacterium]
MSEIKPSKIPLYHQARWNEPIIYELGGQDERGILIPQEGQISTKDLEKFIPPNMIRKDPPALPELSQVETLRHFLRLSQENLGAGFVPDVGMATSTVKYNPPINERIVKNPKLIKVHPLQDEDTIQGILEIIYHLEQFIKEISGMDRVSFQPRSGSQAIYTNVSIMRAYHRKNGEGEKRDEIITTIFSHPSDAAVPHTAGYKVITLYPEEKGYPSVESLKAAVSERTAGLLITNPDDTGIFNPHISEFVEIIHDIGGLCIYDQANANGLLGITRAREVGFDMCHFNLHKTFSTPHASGGPGAGATCVVEKLDPFLPIPTVEFDGQKYWLNYDRPDTIGKVAAFYGSIPNLVRAFTWILAHGSEGLREVSSVAVLNNNYLMKKILQIPGIEAPFEPGAPRIEQVRYSWKGITEKTGVTIMEIANRSVDYAMHFFFSHHPYVVPDPATLEPTESYSYRDLDNYAHQWAKIADEAYNQPEIIRQAPHSAPIHKMVDLSFLDDPKKWSPSWRSYKRKHLDPNKA